MEIEVTFKEHALLSKFISDWKVNNLYLTDEKHIETRMMIFERFLCTIVKMPEICSDEIVEDFLLCEMGQAFSKKKKLFEDKINEMRKKDEIHSILGDEVLLSNTPEIDQSRIAFYHSTANQYEELVK